MTWGIIGAMDDEVALLRDAMKERWESKVYDSTFYHGGLEGQDVVLVCCGIGKVNAALCAAVLLREFGVDRIVHVGIAGAMDPALQVLDVVLSKDVGYHDQGAVYDEHYPFRRVFDADPGLIELAEKACRQDGGIRYHIGRVATGDEFITSAGEKQKILSRMQPLCVEMEGAAVAQAAYMSGVPFLVIRAMSDSADDDAAMTYYEFKERACRQSAGIVRRMLRLAPRG